MTERLTGAALQAEIYKRIRAGESYDDLLEDRPEPVLPLEPSTEQPWETISGTIPDRVDPMDAPKEKSPTLDPDSILADEDQMNLIREFMRAWDGTPTNLSDEMLLRKWMKRNRNFAVGNMYTSANDYFRSQDIKDPYILDLYKRQYDLFNRLDFGNENYSPTRRLGALADYITGIAADPTTVLGVLAGVGVGNTARVATVGGERLGIKGLRKVVRDRVQEASRRVVDRRLEQGYSPAAARLAGADFAREFARKVGKSKLVKNAQTKANTIDLATGTGVDAALSTGAFLAGQQGLVNVGAEDEINFREIGLIALGSLGAAAISAPLQYSARIFDPESRAFVGRIHPDNEMLREFGASRFVDTMNTRTLRDKLGIYTMRWEKGYFEEFTEKVKRGKQLVDGEEITVANAEMEGFKDFFLGGNGIPGLIPMLVDSGLQAQRRYPGDNITNILHDVMVGLPNDTAEQLVDSFNRTAGTAMGREFDNIDELADYWSRQMHEFGVRGNIMSQGSKQLGLNDTFESIVDKWRRKPRSERDDSPRPIGFFQDQLIRTIISHPATTMLNIKGTSVNAALSTGSDLVRGALYSGIGSRGFLTGDMSDWRRGVNMIKGSVGRYRNIINPLSTQEEVEAYLSQRESAANELFRYLAGGVDADATLARYNIDPNSTLGKVAAGTKGYTDFAQTLALTEVTDRVLKSQSFMYNLDMLIRERSEELFRAAGYKNLDLFKGFNGYQDFMSLPPERLARVMASDVYRGLEMAAVDRALRESFSQSFHNGYKGLGVIPSFIEDLRKVPVVGATMPFGQFFNNTVDFMADYSGATMALYSLKGGEDAVRLLANAAPRAPISKDMYITAGAKMAVGWSAIYAVSELQMDNIERGLGPTEFLSSDGSITEQEYDYPDVFFMLMGRAVARIRKGDPVPRELQGEIWRTLGPEAFTRNFSQTADPFFQVVASELQKDDGDVEATIKRLFGASMSSIGSAWISGYTRPLDVPDQFVGLFTGENRAIDPGTGIEFVNKSTRYMDNIISLVDGYPEGTQEFNPALQEDAIRTIGGVTSQRSVPAHSWAMKMFNVIDKPYFMDSIYTEIPEVDNTMREFFADRVDWEARRLFETGDFERMSYKSQVEKVREALQRARNVTLQEMQNNMGSTERSTAQLFQLLRRYSQIDVANAVDWYAQESGEDLRVRDLYSLSPYEISKIERYLRDQQRSRKTPYATPDNIRPEFRN